jgi:hypothetical protein
MKAMKTVLFTAAVLLSGQTSALMIGGGENFQIDWFVDLDNTVTSSDLTATSTWSVSSYSSSSIVLDISITNTTLLDPGVLDEAAITTFGFGVSPDVTAALTSGGTVFTQVDTGSGAQQSFPGGYKGIDVCLFAESCSGGDVKTGLQAGSTDLLQLVLTPTTGLFGNSVDLLFFPAKFQSTLGSFEPAGTVPEPATLALLGSGVLVVAARRRWRQRVAA